MAWMASNIYVKHAHQKEVAQVVESLLVNDDYRRDQEGILDPFAPAVVSPVQGGWVAAVRLGPWISDLPGAAGALAAKLSCQVVCLEMIGNSYRMRLTQFQGGEQTDQQRTPEHGWQGETEDPARMPLYEDAEARAFSMLTELRVPAPLITFGLTPFGPVEAPGAEDAPEDHAEPSLSLAPEGDTVRCETLELPATPPPGEDPPVLPTRITRDFGELLFEERYVDGAPCEEALNRLLSMEEDLLARARRAAPGQEVTLTVTYQAGVHQPRLNALLQGRDRLNLSKDQRLRRAPWWNFWQFFGKVK